MPPTQNIDGSTLRSLAGYFAVSAYLACGVDSDPSSIVIKTIP